ncbi:hypothetical protein FRC08_003313 [Ceratobasidium sp. 394]|nr:hypothetical protein FRC08_003313 [Ceratobasidium sp. 394]KAG9096272.1 hypothetical protein FS749_008805 [Ceratobasidium sp. UAMH 11750]
MRFTSIYALSLVGATLGSPALLLARDDWKYALGWDGKTATPAQLDPSNVHKPTPGVPAPPALSGGVYFCTDADFKGQCLYVAKFASAQCVNFGNEFNDKVTSFGPDPGLACLLWSAWDCQGSNPGGYFVNPGSKNLTDYKFNDVASSFVCKAA